MADGPYGMCANPLYLGGWCMMVAMSFLMPPTGALVCITQIRSFCCG